MSWQSYIDDQLLQAGFMYASINGHDGSLWASSPGFTVSVEEVTQLAKVLQSDDVTSSSIATDGFTIAGQKYTFMRAETNDDDGGPSYLQGRCKEPNKSSQGAIIYCTSSAIVIGIHDPSYSNGASFGKVNTDIGRIADHMIENSY